MSEQIIGPNRCRYCGGEYGEHQEDCRRPKESELARLEKQLSELEASRERMRKLLELLNSRGGLGYDIHGAIDKCLSEPPSDSLRKLLEPVIEAFGIDQPWPLIDTLETLLCASGHLRYDHDCDHTGHESIQHAADRAVELLPKLRKALAALRELT